MGRDGARLGACGAVGVAAKTDAAAAAALLLQLRVDGQVQCGLLLPVLLVRAVPALLQLLLPFHRAAPADPGRLAHRTLHHHCPAIFHPHHLCHQGDH